jgi:hypothetical protein
VHASRRQEHAPQVVSDCHRQRGIAFGCGVLTAQAGDRLRIPAGFRHWYLVNSLLVTKDSPQFDATGVHLSIPLIDDGQLALGTWHGFYFFEHRKRPYDREVAQHLLGV